MTDKDLALLLSGIGFLMSLWGLVLAVRAIWDETHRRDLHPGWRTALEATQSRARALFGRARDTQVMAGTAKGRIVFSGTGTLTATGVVNAEPQTLEELQLYVDRQIAQVREAISVQANDAASRIDALNERVTGGLANVTTRLEEAEEASAEIDAHTLDREMWGLIWVAGGSLLQAIAMFVGR